MLISAPDELRPADLVFFQTYRDGPSHVGIYLGNGRFIHASTGQKKVTITSLQSPYYEKRFLGGKRILVEKIGPLRGSQIQTGLVPAD